MTEFTEYEKAVVGLYLRRLKYEKDVTLNELTFAEGHPLLQLTVKVVRLPSNTESGETLWFSGTVGSGSLKANGHEHQFVGIYDSDSFELTELVASAYHYSRAVSELDYGHTFPLSERMTLSRCGYAAALVLDPGLYRPFEGLRLEGLGITTSFFSIVPIRAEELKLKHEKGLLALMDVWDQEKRDILAVHAAKPS